MGWSRGSGPHKDPLARGQHLRRKEEPEGEDVLGGAGQGRGRGLSAGAEAHGMEGPPASWEVWS